jgi:hypothetical protein
MAMLTVEKIDRYGQEVYDKATEHVGTLSSGVLDVFRFTQALGGSIFKCSGGTKNYPRVTVDPEDGRFLCKIPEFQSSGRDRFSVAHCLYHYLMGYVSSGRNQLEFHECGNYGRNDRVTEAAANMFALALLMPQEQFLEHQSIGMNYSQLADYFRVPVLFVATRAGMLESPQEFQGELEQYSSCE